MKNMATVNKDDIENGLIKLGLAGTRVEVHSSLSSFGNIIGGESAVIEALLNVCDTVLMTTYSFRMQEIEPPKNDRPAQNGINYNYFPGNASNLINAILTKMGLSCSFAISNLAKAASSKILVQTLNWVLRAPTVPSIRWDRTYVPFDPDSFDNNSFINCDMGKISQTFLKTPGALRSKHPSVSLAAAGNSASHYLLSHPADDPLAPLKKLYVDNGHTVLLGVPLQCH
jgi:aminoglycoside N3'-acetyltransferase